MLANQPRRVELLEKNVPRQARAIKTYETILDAAAQLLIDVGVERISTNLIAERAGITVPAVYRYFPNKYSVLNALGSRLMDRQNAVLAAWHEQYADNQPLEVMIEALPQVFEETWRVTEETAAGIHILNALRAVAPLQQVRLDSNREVAKLFGQLWADRMGVEYDELIYRKARFAVELGYAAVEMALEDETLVAEEILEEAGSALKLYLHRAVVEILAR